VASSCRGIEDDESFYTQVASPAVKTDEKINGRVGGQFHPRMPRSSFPLGGGVMFVRHTHPAHFRDSFLQWRSRSFRVAASTQPEPSAVARTLRKTAQSGPEESRRVRQPSAVPSVQGDKEERGCVSPLQTSPKRPPGTQRITLTSAPFLAKLASSTDILRFTGCPGPSLRRPSSQSTKGRNFRTLRSIYSISWSFPVQPI
jgi:hypothetical protein